MKTGLPRAFRLFQALVNQMPDCSIWETLWATTAHPDLLKSIETRVGQRMICRRKTRTGMRKPTPTYAGRGQALCIRAVTLDALLVSAPATPAQPIFRSLVRLGACAQQT